MATTGPERDYVLRNGNEVSLEPGTASDAGGTLRLPAEALIRLVYGRADGDHAKGIALEAAEVTLEDLRATFPGF